MELRQPTHYRFGDFQGLANHFQKTEDGLETTQCKNSQIRIGEDGRCFIKDRHKVDVEGVEVGDRFVGFWTDPSLRRFASFMRVPIRYLFSIDDDRFFTAVVNQRTREKGSEMNGACIRVCPFEGTVVGVTSDTYAYYKNGSLLEDVRRCLNTVDMDEEVMFGGASLWNYRFDMNLLSRTRAVCVRDGDKFIAGLRLINSCDGATSIQVLPVLRKADAQVNPNEWGIGAVNASDKIVRIIHKGTGFYEKLSKALSVSTETFERMVRGMQALGHTHTVEVNKWRKMLGFVATKLGNKKVANDVFEAGVTGFKQHGTLYFLCSKYDTEAQTPIERSSEQYKDRKGKHALVVGYESNQVTSHPDYNPKEHDLWYTTDMKSAMCCDGTGSGFKVNLTSENIRRLEHTEKLIQSRDPYVPFKILLEKADETESQDRRLDFETAAGEILNEFIDE